MTEASSRRGRARGRERGEGPQPVEGLVDALLEKRGIAEKVERARAVARWEEVVGPRIAEVTGRPRVSGRTLFVDVESAAWAQELQMMRHRLLRELNEGVERGRVEKIVFRQAEDRPDGGGAGAVGGGSSGSGGR